MTVGPGDVASCSQRPIMTTISDSEKLYLSQQGKRFKHCWMKRKVTPKVSCLSNTPSPHWHGWTLSSCACLRIKFTQDYTTARSCSAIPPKYLVLSKTVHYIQNHLRKKMMAFQFAVRKSCLYSEGGNTSDASCHPYFTKRDQEQTFLQ